MELRFPVPSTDDARQPLGSKPEAVRGPSATSRPEPATVTAAAPVYLGTVTGAAGTASTSTPAPVPVPAPAPRQARTASTVIEDSEESPTMSGADSTSAPVAGNPAAGAAATPRTPVLRPRRRYRVRLRYLLQAWSVSVFVHIVILSALAAATFTAQDSARKPINFDSALAGYHQGEPEAMPIYADPANIPREQAVGDEFASSPGEPVAVLTGASGGGDDSDDGSVSVAGVIGTGPPSNTPRVRGVSRRKISEEGGAQGIETIGLKTSPLNLLPVAPAVDLGGGGQIGGDPIFDVKEIGLALDQIAREILRHLKDHKLTVVWLFDESASMQDDQRTIREKFDRVSTEIKQNIDPGKKSAGALNHAIIGFGQATDPILKKPTLDIDEIGRAIRKLKVDLSGAENTMRAIRDVIDAYSSIISKDRKLMVILVTDESGDDGSDVEEARLALKKYKVPLYVIGRQSLFGYQFAHHRYVDPVTKDVYHPLIRRGPETADVEIYQWDGLYDRWDEQPSGFAPWELARLTKDSGGIYFLLPSEEHMRVRQREQAYSSVALKEYLPEYQNRLVYVQNRTESELRRTLYQIVTETKSFVYNRDFPIEHEAMIKLAVQEGEKATVKLNALLEIQRRLESPALRKARDREPEKRWQAHYDLVLAQTVAFQVKAYEYRALMARLVQKPPIPTKQPSPELAVTWVVDHAQAPLAPKNETAKKYVEARRLLEAVIAAHPRTPWADLAKDTLDRGLSVTLNEWHHNPKYHERNQFVPRY